MSGVTRSTTPAFIKETNSIYAERRDQLGTLHLHLLKKSIAFGSTVAIADFGVLLFEQTQAGAVGPQKHKIRVTIKSNKPLHLQIIKFRCTEF